MNQKIIKILALIALLTRGCFACTKDGNTDDDKMVSIKIQCKNTGTVDPNIVSFALPGIVFATTYEYPPYLNNGGFPEELNPHFWTTALGMAKETDCTKLAPIITLTPGATITSIHLGTGEQTVSKNVNYTGIAEIGVYDFTTQVSIYLTAPDGSTVAYTFLAFAIDYDLGPCDNCP